LPKILQIYNLDLGKGVEEIVFQKQWILHQAEQ